MAIRIVSHNAFWFQGVPFATTEPDAVHEEVFARLAALYAELNPDLLCLQEVHSAAVASRLGTALAMSWHHSPGCRQPVYGGAVFWRPQWTVRVRDFRSLPDFTPYRSWQRVECDRVGESLHLTNVHLPSSRATPGLPVANVQCEEVTRYALDGLDGLDGLGVAAPADIIVGDFNASPDGAAPALLVQHGYYDAAELAGQGQAPTSVRRKRGDHAWLSAATSRRLLAYRVVDLAQPHWALADPAKRTLSDHFPLVVDLQDSEEARDRAVSRRNEPNETTTGTISQD